MKHRTVVLVGRPNVGKSAVFNRLARGRVAIVHGESGTTRDRLSRDVFWGDHRFKLVDTGGLCDTDRTVHPGDIETGIRKQVGLALRDAGVVLLVVDVANGLHPMDEEIARLVRSSGCAAFVAANKADTELRDDSSDDFHRLGFPVFPVSALHNRGFDELLAAVVPALPADESGPAARDPLKVAIVGRPNAGKSSLINRILRDERLIVSEVPGTTRDSIDVPFTMGSGANARHYLLIDTAGLRPAARRKTSVENFSRMRTEESVARCDVAVLIVDGSGPPTDQDSKIAGMAIEHGRGCVIIVSKWDLATTSIRKYEKELRYLMPFVSFCPVVFASAKSGFNVRGCLETIDAVGTHIVAQLQTGLLNRAIGDAVEKVHPPSMGGKPLKIYYGTQVGSRPVRIRLFVNDPRRVLESYRGYLINEIRSRFGLEGAPIVLHFRGRA